MHGQLKRRLRGAVPPLRILRSPGTNLRVKDKRGDAKRNNEYETETGDVLEVTRADRRRR